MRPCPPGTMEASGFGVAAEKTKSPCAGDGDAVDVYGGGEDAGVPESVAGAAGSGAEDAAHGPS